MGERGNRTRGAIHDAQQETNPAHFGTVDGAPLLVRNAQRLDLPEVARVHLQAWRDAYRPLGSAPTAWLATLPSRLERWQRRFEQLQGPEHLIVAELGGQVIGFSDVGATTNALPNHERASGELRALYVHPDHWRHDIGRSLAQVSMMHSSRWGIRRLYAHVRADNHHACQFLQALGWQRLGPLQRPTPLQRVVYVSPSDASETD